MSNPSIDALVSEASENLRRAVDIADREQTFFIFRLPDGRTYHYHPSQYSVDEALTLLEGGGDLTAAQRQRIARTLRHASQGTEEAYSGWVSSSDYC